MTQEEKQILIKDLCTRIPYRTFVQLNPGAYNKPETCFLTGVHGEKIHLNVDSDPFRIDHIKPYLRPMSSMTSKEWVEFCDCSSKDEASWVLTNNRQKFIPSQNREDYLNAKHFDHRGLIPMGLALEAPKDMYKQ